MSLYVLRRPVITEKSLQLANKQNIYMFEVDRVANKHQIKDAVEVAYGVEVADVNTIVRHRMTKATGKKRMKKVCPKTKKALVKLKPNFKIELFDVGGEK